MAGYARRREQLSAPRPRPEHSEKEKEGVPNSVAPCLPSEVQVG